MSKKIQLSVRLIVTVALLLALTLAIWKIYRNNSFWTVQDYQAKVASHQYSQLKSRITWSQPKDRMNAMVALSQSNDQEAYDILLESAKSQEKMARLAIASSLENLPAQKREALGALLLQDSEPAVVEVARNHLNPPKP